MNTRASIEAKKVEIERIAREYGLLLVVLYGSVARGTERAMSDIDIGVLGSVPISHEEEAELTEKIARATDLPHVEVRSLHRTSPLFLHQVMQDGIILYADSPTRARALALYAWQLATESAPRRHARYTRSKERIAAYV